MRSKPVVKDQCPNFQTLKFVKACVAPHIDMTNLYSSQYIHWKSQTSCWFSPPPNPLWRFVLFFFVFLPLWSALSDLFTYHASKCGDKNDSRSGVESWERQSSSFWQMQTEAQSWARWAEMFFASSTRICVNHRLFWCLDALIPVQKRQRSRGVQPPLSYSLKKKVPAYTWLSVASPLYFKQSTADML